VFKNSCLEAEKLTTQDVNFNFDKMDNLYAYVTLNFQKDVDDVIAE